jgi:hypothetical protein
VVEETQKMSLDLLYLILSLFELGAISVITLWLIILLGQEIINHLKEKRK